MRGDLVGGVSIISQQIGVTRTPNAALKKTIAGAAFFIGVAMPLQATAQPTVSFSKQVLPIFESHCIQCHSTGGVGQISSSMSLMSYKDLRDGGIHGVALVPFHSDRSPIIRYLKDDWKSENPNALKMPPLGPPLPDSDIKLIADWIDQGAKNN
jgi:mono/diheme cytochrome c family protein